MSFHPLSFMWSKSFFKRGNGQYVRTVDIVAVGFYKYNFSSELPKSSPFVGSKPFRAGLPLFFQNFFYTATLA